MKRTQTRPHNIIPQDADTNSPPQPPPRPPRLIIPCSYTSVSDPDIPAASRAEAAKWGLCKDEFPETQGFPPALYVRGARRLVGDRVFTQNTPKDGIEAGESVGLGNYNFGHCNTTSQSTNLLSNPPPTSST